MYKKRIMHVLTIDFNESRAAEKFSLSLKKTGFAVLKNHPIESELIDSIYHDWTEFFQSNHKGEYLYNRKSQDGYFPMSVSETAKGASVKDLKAYFQYYPWGQYPRWMNDNTKKLYEDLKTLASTLLGWLERALPDDIRQHLSVPLSHMIDNSLQTMLRIIYYPALSGDEPSGAVRAAAHEDINLLTLLVGATSAGLQVQDVDGKWHDVPCTKDNIVVNIGDMLSLATNHYYRSTTHRVINPDVDNVARLSMPLFLHPRPDIQLSSDKTAGEYLQERLRELGVV